MRILSAFGLLLASAFLWAANSTLPQLPGDQVVARVNGVELRGRALNDYVDVLVPNLTVHGKVEADKIKMYRRQALDRMVLHELIYQDAVRRGFHVRDADVDAEITTIRNRFRSQQAFERSLAAQGLTLEGLRTQLKHNWMIAAVVRQDITERAKVGDQEARLYYDRNRARFRQPESVQVRHIFLPLNAEGERQANEVRRMATAKNTSEEFDSLARRYSKDDYRVMGGMLGSVHRGRLEPELEKSAFSLNPGEISPVIRTSTGFHLLRVEAKQPERMVPFSEAKDKLRGELASSKTKRLRDELRTRVYKHANIELLARF